MQLTITKDVPATPPSFAEARSDVLPVEANAPRTRQHLLRKLAFSTAVWVFYVPHLAMLRLLGPRLGLTWARGVARIHWLLSFLGAQRSVRAALENSRGSFRTDLTISSILRKHLELKHECFARTKLFNHAGTRDVDQDQLIWQVEPALIERFRQMKESGKGLIIVGYHFGFFPLSATALARIFPGCDAVHMSHRTAHYSSDAFEAVAQLALEKAYAADQQSGARIEYMDSGRSLLRICRMLLEGETVAVAADGAFAHDFVDVPFLSAKLRLPYGWARMAAATGSNILVLLETEIDRQRRRVCVFDHVQVRGDSPEEVHRAVAEAGKILDDFVRREPWAWHPWGRLRCEKTPEGSIYHLAMGASFRAPQLSEVTNTVVKVH